MNIRRLLCLSILVGPVTFLGHAAEKKIYGRYEQVKLVKIGETLIPAKLDTGAYTASLGAEEIEVFKKGKTEWVRFRPQLGSDKQKKIELPLVKIGKVKKRHEEKGDREKDEQTFSERPVIELEFCLGKVVQKTPVNLVDRSAFRYSLLLGADALKDFRALVDPSVKDKAEGPCKVSKGNAKTIYGRYENIQFPSLGNEVIRAKLDSGAKTASLGAENIEFFTKKGEDWVRFTPQFDGKNGKKLEYPIYKISKIRKRLTDNEEPEENEEKEEDDGRLHLRPVVEMEICLGHELRTIQVNLTDRSNFRYPLLLGAKALRKFNAIIDSSLKNQSEPICK